MTNNKSIQATVKYTLNESHPYYEADHNGAYSYSDTYCMDNFYNIDHAIDYITNDLLSVILSGASQLSVSIIDVDIKI